MLITRTNVVQMMIRDFALKREMCAAEVEYVKVWAFLAVGVVVVLVTRNAAVKVYVVQIKSILADLEQ